MPIRRKLIRDPITPKPKRLVVEEGTNINPMARQRTKAAPMEEPTEPLVFKPVKPQRVGRFTRPSEGIPEHSPADFQAALHEIASEHGEQFDDLTGWEKDAFQMYVEGNDEAESCII